MRVMTPRPSDAEPPAVPQTALPPPTEASEQLSASALGVKPKSPESVAGSHSDLSDMPGEFSDIDEPPTRSLVSGDERTSFTDTNEIAMPMPKTGKRTCVTHHLASDGKRELALGLRAMVTLDLDS